MSDQLKGMIAGRKWGDEIINAWVHPVFAGENDMEDFKRGAAKAFREWSDSVLGKPETELRIMDEEEAAKFELKTLSFGSHQGNCYIDVDNLCEASDKDQVTGRGKSEHADL